MTNTYIIIKSTSTTSQLFLECKDRIYLDAILTWKTRTENKFEVKYSRLTRHTSKMSVQNRLQSQHSD